MSPDPLAEARHVCLLFARATMNERALIITYNIPQNPILIRTEHGPLGQELYILHEVWHFCDTVGSLLRKFREQTHQTS